MIKKVSNKNGLIELFRFLCSVWVAYYHGFFPILSDKFDGVNISVDFFFMVSGFFFLRSIEKHKEKSFWEGVHHIFWGRTKRFITPLVIAGLSILLCNIIFKLDFSGYNWPLSFLWFFAAQFVYLSLFYAILKVIKRRPTFNLICFAIMCISMSVFLFMPDGFAKQFDRVFRGPAMLALGMLVSQIPKIQAKIKDKIKATKRSLIVNTLGFFIAAIAFIYLAYTPKYAVWKLHLFLCVVCSSLLYFGTALPVRSRLLNLLGEFSVFVYLAQCPILLHLYAGNKETEELFPWLCFYAVLLFTLNRIINQIIIKRKAIT